MLCVRRNGTFNRMRGGNTHRRELHRRIHCALGCVYKCAATSSSGGSTSTTPSWLAALWLVCSTAGAAAVKEILRAGRALPGWLWALAPEEGEPGYIALRPCHAFPKGEEQPRFNGPAPAGYPPREPRHVYLSICLLARSCLGAARPRCIVAPGIPLERTPPGVSAGVLASLGVTAPGRLAPVPSPLTQTPLVQP